MMIVIAWGNCLLNDRVLPFTWDNSLACWPTSQMDMPKHWGAGIIQQTLITSGYHWHGGFRCDSSVIITKYLGCEFSFMSDSDMTSITQGNQCLPLINFCQDLWVLMCAFTRDKCLACGSSVISNNYRGRRQACVHGSAFWISGAFSHLSFHTQLFIFIQLPHSGVERRSL